jgi:hypothetical protein
MNDSGTKEKSGEKGYFLPDIGDIMFFVVLHLLLYIKPDMLLNDGSTGWHIVTGKYILQQHSIPHHDIMSYTFANKPWVAYEWFSDLIMAILVQLGGLNLLYVTSTIAIAFIVLWLYVSCRENGSNFVFATFITILGALLSAIHWLARPHLFTFFGVFIFTTQLKRYYSGLLSRKKLLLYLTLYMLIWANSHPGFLLGLVIIGVYLVSSLIEFVFLKQKATEPDQQTNKKEQIITFFTAGILSAVASLCTPYGFQLYSYIANYLFKANTVIAATDEFQSPVFHGAMQPGILEILFALTILGLIITKNKIALPDLILYVMFAHLSLSAQRNMALFVFVNVPIIARMYANTILDSPAGDIYLKLRKIWQFIIAKFKDLNDGFTENERKCSYHLLPIIASIILIIIAMNGGKVFGHPIINADFNDNNKPTKNLELIKQLKLDPKHGFSMDNWGGIIRFKLDYPVFIDDRADFYGQDFYIEYAKLLQTAPGWQKLLAKHQIQWVLLPKKSRLAEELKTDSRWQVKGEDTGSLLLLQKACADL